MGTSAFLESLIRFYMSKHVSNQQMNEWRAPHELCGERRAHPAEEVPPLSAQHHHQAKLSWVQQGPSHTNKTLFTGTQNTLNFPSHWTPPWPQICKIPPSQPRTLWTPQQCPRLLCPLPLHPFQAAFSTRTPAKTILHRLQQTSPAIPHKPYHNPAADFWLCTEPLYLNTRENTPARH